MEKLAERFGVVAEQECRLCGAGVPGGNGWPKRRCFAERANRPQGPQSKQTKTKRRDHDTFLNKSFRNRKSIENCSVWWFSLRCVLVTFGGGSAPVPLYNRFCNRLTASKNRARMIENCFFDKNALFCHTKRQNIVLRSVLLWFSNALLQRAHPPLRNLKNL